MRKYILSLGILVAFLSLFVANTNGQSLIDSLKATPRGPEDEIGTLRMMTQGTTIRFSRQDETN